MKYVLKLTLFALWSFFGVVNACYNHNEIVALVDNDIHRPEGLNDFRVFSNRQGFYIIKDNLRFDILRCFCAHELLEMSNYELNLFLKRCKPKLVIMPLEVFDPRTLCGMVELGREGQYALANRLLGGGPISVNQMNGDDVEYIHRFQGRLLGGVGTNERNDVRCCDGCCKCQNCCDNIKQCIKYTVLGGVLAVVGGFGGALIMGAITGGEVLRQRPHTQATPATPQHTNQAAPAPVTMVDTPAAGSVTALEAIAPTPATEAMTAEAGSTEVIGTGDAPSTARSRKTGLIIVLPENE